MGKDWDAPWKSGAGMSAPGIGERAIPWPSFGGSMPFGGANPTCAECGGRLRGGRKCACVTPVWMVDGEVVDGGSRGQSEAVKQKKLFQSWCVTWLKECYRVLRPGGTAKVFGATRMMHRMAAAMEEAGFLLDPEHSLEGWGYGCLTEDTEVLTADGWVHYHRAKVGTLILGFDLQTGAFGWQPVEETFEYPYDREAFHIFGPGTDHIVSIRHRCVVQRDGQWVFVLSGDLEVSEVVPCVQGVLHPQEVRTTDVREVLCEQAQGPAEEAPRGAEGPVPHLHGLRDTQVVSRGMDQEGNQATDLFQEVQRSASGAGLGEVRSGGGCRCDSRGESTGRSEDDRLEQSRLEGRGDVLQEARELRPAWPDQVHPVPLRVPSDGPQGWVRDGASTVGGTSAGSVLAPSRDGASPESQPDRQQAGEPGAVRLESGPQAVRGSWDTSPHLAGVTAQVERVHYTGIVWCVKVPTGAFVARRNGKAFVTGNSGFPKSLNISKVLDKMAGAEREVVGTYTARGFSEVSPTEDGRNQWAAGVVVDKTGLVTIPATPEAQQFDGYGTALKPAWEPFIVGRKPA